MKSGRGGIEGSAGGAGTGSGTGAVGWTGCGGAGAAPAGGISTVGTRSLILQFGQLPFFPDALSGTRISELHSGQLNSIAIRRAVNGKIP